jgi:hypothetical protein
MSNCNVRILVYIQHNGDVSLENYKYEFSSLSLDRAFCSIVMK